MRLEIFFWLSLLGWVSLANASLVDDVVNALKNGATCASCHALFAPLKLLALIGDGPFSSTFIAVCKALGTVDADVCEGAIKLEGPILAQDLRSIDPFGQVAEKLCDALFGLCQPPAVNAYSVPFPKPAPTNPKTFISSGKPPFQVVHFSDVHIDRQYTPGSDANCTKPICCRPYADKQGPVTVPAGIMGNHKCDTPAGLAQNFLRSVSGNNKFSIFTGDVVEASVWLTNQKDVTNDLQLFNAELASILGVPVFPALGNHESAPTNSFPRNTTTKSNSQWVFDTVSKGWEPFIGTTAAGQVAHISGSYSVNVADTNLKIISINNVYWYKSNYWLYDSDKLQPDPNGILAFTVQELQAAEDAGQRAWIIGHIPPGGQDVLRDQSNYFDQIVQRYKNTIAGQFYGHSHQDQFMLAYSDYAHRSAETAVSVAWIAPAITPRGGNPAFKVYDVDPDTYEIMDAKVYRSDLANPTFDIEPTWELYYSARAAYGPAAVPSLSPSEPLGPAFWHHVTEAFERDDAVFQMYQTFRKRGVDPIVCDDNCKKTTICGIRALRAENSCSVSTPGLNFRRDPTGESVHGDECEGAGLSHIFQGLSDKLATTDWERLREQLRAIIPDDV